MATLANLARVTTATTGTGTITLGSAASGCLTFAQAGITDGQTVSYGIEDGSNSEVGRGVYTASGTTLTRAVLKSTNSDSAINLSGTAEVFIVAVAEDIALRGAMVKKSSDQTGANYTTATEMTFATEVYDVGGWFDAGSSTTRLTVPAGVNYVEVSGYVIIANQTLDTWTLIQAKKNGSADFDGACGQRSEVGASAPLISFRSGAIPVVAGDYFELTLQTESDTSIDINATRTNFSIRAVG